MLAAVPLVPVPSAGPATAGVSAPATTAAPAEVRWSEARIQDPVVLYARHTQNDPLRVPIEAELVSEHGVSKGGDFEVNTAPDENGDYVEVDRGTLARRSGTSIWTGTTTFTRSAPTGKYGLQVFYSTYSESPDSHTLTWFHVKRNTMMPAFNASPEPVRRGSPVKVGGRLTKLWPDVGYGGKTIEVHFKPVGGTWTLKGTAMTDSNGCWSRSFTASEDGTWQARFKGTSNYHAETSHRDYVDVQ